MAITADITSFFPEEDATTEELQIGDCKKFIYKLAAKGHIDTLQYTYFDNFIKTSGTVCNINYFLKQIQELQTPKPKQKEFDRALVDQFTLSIAQSFCKFFKYVESSSTEDKDNSGTQVLRINKSIKYYMSRLESIDFTAEQKKALQSLYEFLIDDERNTFGLYGFAGSGKTTSVVEFVSYMIRNKYLKRISFAAPTNKALNVIKMKFKPHIRIIVETLYDKKLDDTFNFDNELDFLETNGIVISFLTVNKLLMFHMDYSVTGETIFVRDNRSGSRIPEYELVIIDECSMISMDMIDSIFEEIRSIANAKSAKNSKNNHIRVCPKVVFTGDPAQLPPVNETDSSIFCKNIEDLPFQIYMDTMSSKFSGTIVSNLTSLMKYKYDILLKDLATMQTVLLQKVVRSKIGNVTKVCHEMRQWIRTDDLPNLQQFCGVKGVSFCDSSATRNKIESEWFQKFLKSIKNGDTSIIITWTNRQTDTYNDTVRKHIFRGKKIKKFEEHDVLMLSEFYGLDLGEGFVKQRLHTSEQIKVVSTRTADIPIGRFETIVCAGIKKMKQGIKIEGRIKLLVDALNDTFCKDTKFMCWILKVHKLGEDGAHCMSIIVVDDTDSDNIEKYNKYRSDSKTAINNFAKQMLYTYKTCPKQIDKLIIKPLWKQWNRVFVDSYANVNYGYSITCHKAQGSSFHDVYVDLDDILQNSRSVEAKKCAYTACTRPSNELNLLV